MKKIDLIIELLLILSILAALMINIALHRQVDPCNVPGHCCQSVMHTHTINGYQYRTLALQEIPCPAQ